MPRHTVFSNFLLAISITCAVGLSLWGWLSLPDQFNVSFGDAVYRSFSALLVSDIYTSSSDWQGDWRIEYGRWFGVFAFVLGAAKAIMVILASRVRGSYARLFRRNHLIVIGEDPFANEIVNVALANGMTVTWLAASKTQSLQLHKRLFVLEGVWNIAQAKEFGIVHAKSVAIATRDDASAIAIAREIRQVVKDEDQLKVFVTANSPWVAMRIDEVEGVYGIRIFSRAQAAARQVHRKHPPFLIAQKQDQKRIHSVIIGFGQFGEAIFIDTLLSCLTTYLEKPLITIVDPKVKVIRNRINLRYPEISKSAELGFVEGDIEGSDSSLSEDEILKIGSQTPVSLVYICLPDQTSSISAGLAVQALARRYEWTTGPIFVRLSDQIALPQALAGVSNLANAQLLGFGELVRLVYDTGVLNEDVDSLAIAMHNGYRNALIDKGKEADKPWKDLSEDMRDSNRRIFFHLAAKCSSAGIDIENWLVQLDENPGSEIFPQAFDFSKQPDLVDRMAKLEHERWMADRRLNGWSYCEVRNNLKRFHPDLIPFDQLNEKSKTYNRESVRTLYGAIR